jgi:Zn-dependent protease/sulfur carrier protein ThiS
MPRTGTIQLARVFGIRIGVSTSWFVVLFFYIWILSGLFHDVLGSGSQAFEVAVASALLFFVSLILHELGHALAARQQGIQIEGIDLWFFGGLAKMRGEAPTPGAEFWIAVAGPLVTLLVIAACTAVGAGTSSLHHFFDAAVLTSGVHASAGLVIIGWLATINALLLVFNLVPALPFDGGRIAVAIGWKLTGDRNRATRAAARVGRGFAFLLSGFGLLLIVNGNISGGVWALILGMFLSQAARGTLLQTALSERIRDVKVADIMDRNPVTVPGTTTLLDAQDAFFHRYKWPWFAVVDDTGHFLGLLQEERVETELREGRPALSAAEIADDGPPWRIDSGATLEALLGSEGLRRLGAVVAVDGDGVLRGVVTLAQVRRALTPTTGV